MQLKETLTLIGLPLPSDMLLKIFRGRIYKMSNQEKEHTMDIVHDMKAEELLEVWDVPFSPQFTFESFMTGGSKHLRTLSANEEKMIKASDGSTTEHYKNKQNESTMIWNDGWSCWLGRGHHFSSTNVVSSSTRVCCLFTFASHCGICVPDDDG